MNRAHGVAGAVFPQLIVLPRPPAGGVFGRGPGPQPVGNVHRAARRRDGAAYHPGGRGRGKPQAEQPQVVAHAHPVRPELQQAAVLRGGGQVLRQAAGHPGEPQAAGLLLPGEQVFPGQAHGQTGQGQSRRGVYRQGPAAGLAPVQGGGPGKQGEAAVQHTRQGQRQGGQRQRDTQGQQKAGQIIFVGDLEQQHPGQQRAVDQSPVPHGVTAAGAGAPRSGSPRPAPPPAGCCPPPRRGGPAGGRWRPPR